MYTNHKSDALEISSADFIFAARIRSTSYIKVESSISFIRFNAFQANIFCDSAVAIEHGK